MLFQNVKINDIVLPDEQRNKLVQHCLRKLNEDFLGWETKEKKAFGLIGGKIVGNALCINYIQPLYENWRTYKDYKEYMDKILAQYAELSETPLANRGWIANPYEIEKMLKECTAQKIELIGTYHMHRVPWKHDLTRELPTKLDSVLAKDSELFTVIISAVNPAKMIIRAFYESIPEQEINIL